MNKKRIGIIGVGRVGSTLAYLLAVKNIYYQILLKDIQNNNIDEISLDLSQTAKAANSKTIITSTQHNELFSDCDLIVITADIYNTLNQNKDNLLPADSETITKMIINTTIDNPHAIIIIVSNSLEAMIYSALKTSKWSRNKIIGMGGILDNSRMSHFIQEKLDFIAEEISSVIIGGQGDNMVPLTNVSTVNGKVLNELFSQHEIQEIVHKTKTNSYRSIKQDHENSDYYSTAFSVLLMVESILLDKKEVYPCSIMLEGEYGYYNVVAGVPVQLGKRGVEKVIQMNLSEEQKYSFSKFIDSSRALIKLLNKKEKNEFKNRK
ncbi:MAG: malate dehydrogenase [Arcobacteraceae bacterium]